MGPIHTFGAKYFDMFSDLVTSLIGQGGLVSGVLGLNGRGLQGCRSLNTTKTIQTDTLRCSMVHWLTITTSRLANSKVTLASTKTLYTACQGRCNSRTLSCKRSQHTYVKGAETRSNVFLARTHLLSSAAFAASAIVIWYLRQTTLDLLADVNTTHRPSGRRTVAYRGIQHELCRILARLVRQSLQRRQCTPLITQ